MGTETPKTVIITGVTRGLGEALAGRFIEAGHTVWGCGRSQSAIQELKARWGAPHCFESVDVTKGEQVQNWLDPLLRQKLLKILQHQRLGLLKYLNQSPIMQSLKGFRSFSNSYHMLS